MDLFAAAGVDLSDGGRGGGRASPAGLARTLKVPLLNYKVVEEARKRVVFDPTGAQLAAARDYAKTAKSPKFKQQRETAVRNLFFDEVLCKLLGYRKYDPDRSYTLAFERPIRRGAVDVALGRFPGAAGTDDIVAPFEAKGPDTDDLDAIMPGRGISPVQQAWNYAIDAPGSRWVLITNCVEIRLYAFGRGRDAYEVFDLRKLDDPDEHARLWLILAADRFIGGATETLLRETDSAYKDITNELYSEYSTLRGQLIGFLTGSADGPKLATLPAIETAQKLLDRILFIAFAQRTDLLPDKLLERAAVANNEFRPEPLWKNFLSLFRYVDTGSARPDIWGYNGGLFAPDAIADEIIIPDPLATDLANLGRWDYRSDVPVTVLGHIFEQSITDLEKLRAESLGLPEPKTSKRKREGVVYTPDIVTRFLVERTIGVTLAGRSGAILAKLGKSEATFDEGEHDIERRYWREYLAALRDMTILDPACGSGAFLVAAFDLLAAEYSRIVKRLADLGDAIDFDPFDEIVTKNLYGVDLNAESVEITRLALWLKTARRKHRLQNLEATIKTGNSLIDDKDFTDKPFDWGTAFPEVFARGKFDVVIGNPPYVRMELIKPVKPYLEKNYVVAADRADLYAYFFERGVRLLKDGGRLGYISSSTFFSTGSGENLRTFLGDGVAIESVIDFGDLQLFEGVTTYPAIVTLRKGEAADSGTLRFLKIDDDLPKDLSAAFEAQAETMPRARLTASSWRFEDDALAKLRDKIVAGKKTLGEVFGAPLRGIVTGLNEAFVIDMATRDRLVAADPKSADLLKPFLRGENIKRWRVEPEGLFLINTPRGKVKIDDYPAVRDWLLPFKKELEARATKQDWWELQQAQLAYHGKLASAKIVWPHFQIEPSFSKNLDGNFLNNKCFFIASDDDCLVALLNSRCSWFQLVSLARLKRGGYVEAEAQYVEKLSFPNLRKTDRVKLSKLAETCSKAGQQRFDLQHAVSHRIHDLAPSGTTPKLTRKLEHWHELDFDAFRAEVKRAFHADIALKERGEWESYLADNAAQVHKLTADIEAAEREIDDIVYGLFELTPDEIARLENSLAGQY